MVPIFLGHPVYNHTEVVEIKYEQNTKLDG